jgi:cytochrome b subunit of formate dehydrogenase
MRRVVSIALVNSPNRKLLIVAWIQALFYFATGLWSLVDIHSFMAVTGPKTDIWLVRTVGLLVAVTGIVLGWAARRKSIPLELAAIAVGQALALAAIDIFYVSINRISPVYLLDAVAEIGLVGCWVFAWRSGGVTSNSR